MKTKTPEKRIFPIALETRKDPDGNDSRVLVGMPIVYEKRSENFGNEKYPFYETIRRGAATNALKRSDARALYDHGGNGTLPLGRESAKTLQLRETQDGVESVIFLPNTTFANDLAASVERGDLREMSFAFYLAAYGDFYEKRDGAELRTITEFDEILDVSIVPFAAYPDTSVALSRRDKWHSARDAEKRQKHNDEQKNLEIDILLGGY